MVSFNISADFARRLRDVRVTVSSTESSSVNEETECGYFPGALNFNFTLITCNTPIIGHYIRLQIMSSQSAVLSVYEIEVHGIAQMT